MCEMSASKTFTVVVAVLLMTRTSLVMSEDSDINPYKQCEEAIKEIEKENHATIVDDSPSRLQYTWLSQQCETRAGPQYILRKYTFFKNNTFLLLRYHYADESCSIATHTVIIRGSIKLLKPSSVVSGATETRFHVDAVNILPLTPEITQKFGQKLNLTCGPQPKWRLYTSALIYEQPRQHSVRSLWQSPKYNSLQATNKQLGINCLEPFRIEFTELKLLRVHNKVLLGHDTFNGTQSYDPNFELLLANSASNAHSRRNYKPTSLQSTALYRQDSTTNCPICSSVFHSTESSPPLLHQTAPLPAMIGGIWHSERCESSAGGIWSTRKFQIYSGDELWVGLWNYYNDPNCLEFLYGVLKLGSYVLRAERQDEELDRDIFPDYFLNTTEKFVFKRSLTDTRTIPNAKLYQNSLYNKNGPSTDEKQSKDKRAQRRKRAMSDSVHQFLYAPSSIIQSRFAAMMRGHQTYESTTERPFPPSKVLIGTTELDLHVVKNVLIPRHPTISSRCDKDRFDSPLTTSKNCGPRTIETSPILELRVKLGVNWYGQYILLLGSRDDNTWSAPLRRCSQLSPYNSSLRTYLQRILYIGLFSSASTSRISTWFLLSQILLCIYYLVR
ncbi:Protein APCDD1 [Camponotus floridanus]|uniref:Protein APCDD1 n=1 Tax=Camponotus floridanus TaxID=104421 RepID=E1ZVB6_CAMFO|nr:protein APCDD1 [Camponotus floridanus]EFN74892.1 Protein APCDD1 [Camponotus floridanus]